MDFLNLNSKIIYYSLSDQLGRRQLSILDLKPYKCFWFKSYSKKYSSTLLISQNQPNTNFCYQNILIYNPRIHLQELFELHPSLWGNFRVLIIIIILYYELRVWMFADIRRNSNKTGKIFQLFGVVIELAREFSYNLWNW